MDSVSILLVDDRPENLLALTAILESPNYDFITVRSGEEAVIYANEQEFAVILLDINMDTGIDGFETARRIRNTMLSKDTPIIFITAMDAQDTLIARSYAVGGADYISRPVVPEIIRAKVAIFAQLCRRTMQLRRQLEKVQQLHQDVIDQKLTVEIHQQLLEQSQIAREQAEDSQRRMRFLAEASAALANTLDDEATLKVIARLCLPAIADACVINLVDADGNLRNLVATHIDPVKEPIIQELLQRVVPDQDQADLSKDVLRTRQSILVAQVTDDLLKGIARDADQLALLRSFNLRSVVFVPLPARGQILGVLSLYITEGSRIFDETALALAEELARRAAVAIDNARLYRELQEAVKARDEFLSVAAHELKTPITGVRGFAQLLLRQLKKNGTIESAALQRSLERIDQQSDKLSHLVEQLLDISRIQEGQLVLQKQSVDLAALVQNTILTFRSYVTTHTLTVHGPQSLTIALDPLRIEQVLANLINNAIKYSPDQTSIDVELKWVGTATVEIAITDQGPGIPPDQRENLFTRFYRTKAFSNISGIGLGLYISRRIVELHGGQITAEFPDSGGSHFVIQLPVQTL